MSYVPLHDICYPLRIHSIRGQHKKDKGNGPHFKRQVSSMVFKTGNRHINQIKTIFSIARYKNPLPQNCLPQLSNLK